MTRRRCLELALAVACLSCGHSVRAAGKPDAAFPAEPLSADELSRQRGGFRWGGLDIRFGADIRSYLDDNLVVQTRVDWAETANSQRMTNTSAAQPGVELDPAAATAAGLNIKLGDGDAVVLNQGQTAFIHRTAGAIQNIVLNMASNVALRQQIDATLDIGGFAPFANAVAGARVGAAFSIMGRVAALQGRSN